MLSKLRPSRRRAVSAAERGGKRLWRHFRGTLPGGLVEALAFCCPNWFWKKPNLDRSDYKSAPQRSRNLSGARDAPGRDRSPLPYFGFGILGPRAGFPQECGGALWARQPERRLRGCATPDSSKGATRWKLTD